MAEINVPDVNRPWLDAFDGADNALRFAAGVLTVLAQSDVMDDPERDALEAALEYVRTAQEKVQVLNEIRRALDMPLPSDRTERPCLCREDATTRYEHPECPRHVLRHIPPKSASSGDTP